MLFAVILSCLVASAWGSDDPCTSRNGNCQYDNGVCTGHYESGLCDGPGSRRCCIPANTAGCPNLVSRADWGADPPTHWPTSMHNPAQYVFIHHGTGAFCHSQSECSAIVRQYQDYHISGHGWADIGYNFVVGEDGHAYVARGWTAVGAHTSGYNDKGIAICVIGDFTNRVPNTAAQNTIKALITCGLHSGYISQSYTLKGHRDVGQTECPGNSLYQLIHSWPHYAAGTATYG